MPSSGTLMLVGFFITLFGGLPIGFALALAALIFIWVEGTLPGVIFAQQMARGIDNFVLLAIPFFILVGYLMEANGMSVRLIELLQRAVGRMRGGLNVVMVTSMVLFSGISGSKMADVAAVGSVLIPAARRSRQNPGSAVALLAASAVMAETIPPCINLIILGFVANLSIGGLFVAGLLPAGLMALALIAVSIIFGKTPARRRTRPNRELPMSGLWSGAIASFGLIFMIFAGFKSGFATATEISAFAVVYAIVIGSLVFRELSLKTAAHSFVQAATRSGLVLFIVAAAQSLAFILTLQQVPHAVGEMMLSLSGAHGTWLFMLLSIAVLIVMGSVLEGAAALIIFGPLLLPVAVKLGIDPLHFGVVLVIAMGHRPVRAAARARALRRLPDRQRADRTDRQADHGLSRTAAAVPAGDRLRARPSAPRCRTRSATDEENALTLKVLLTHTPQARRQYYGERSLSGLQALAQVVLHEADDALDAAGLIEAARDVDIIVADRLTEGPGEIFPQLPKLRAFVRCAVDIRNIDVEAASAAGVLVTRAGPGFVPSVAELALGFLVDLSRGISRATRGLSCGADAGGRDGAAARRQHARHHRLWQHRPLSRADRESAGHEGSGRRSLRDRRATPASSMCRSRICLRASDYVVCLAVANEADREPDRAGGAGADAAARLLHQPVARQSRRRGRVGRGVAREPHCRRGDGCRPRPRPDADAGAGKTCQTSSPRRISAA